MTRRRLVITAVVTSLLLAGATTVIRQEFYSPKTITAYFTSATGIYPGDQVRISGVRVGTVAAIAPEASRVKLTLEVDQRYKVPADAKAVIVAQNLVAARYVQLAPAYSRTGPVMADGAVITQDHTAVPVEWDQVKDQLSRLAKDLGPTAGMSSSSAGRFINSAADAMGGGNADKLRQTLAQLSSVGRIIADGSGNIVDIVENLQTFVTALSNSNTQIVQFQDRLATFSSVVDDSRTDLDATLSSLAVTVKDVQRFIANTRDKTSEQVQRVADVTHTLTDQKLALENILHAAPTAFSNGYNIYNPNAPGPIGTFILNNFSNPIQFICGAIGAVQNTTAPETAKLCAQYLGPAMRLMNANYLPFPLNPVLQRSITPDKVVYADPRLAPGGSGPAPTAPETPPAVSAYPAAGGIPAPPASGPPPGPAPSLPEVLLPGGTPPSIPPSIPPPAPEPTEGTPPA